MKAVSLSLLIPVYNFEITTFIETLSEQCGQIQIPYEIRVYDDGSTDLYKQSNRAVVSLKGVVYEEMSTNLGRSGIRNKLAREAACDYLLFMDCDSKVTRRDFIRKYTDHIKPESIIYGGRDYQSDPPENKKLLLRWLYGINREVTDAGMRRKNPYRSFMTNNFLIPKKIFNRIRLDEDLTGYGHEDTLFGLKLSNRKVPVCHIDNPLCHIGLETAEEFLQKTGESIQNLGYLYLKGYLKDETSLLRTYRMLKRWHALSFIYGLLKGSRYLIIRNLKSTAPNLWFLDLYKLYLLIHYLRK